MMGSVRARAEMLARSPAPTPASAIADEAIWKKLKEAGFDEETVKKRDKAALISYIAKLESEVYDYQHHMGLLILEKKEWQSKYEQVKESAEAAELTYKHDKASFLSTIAESKKQEENLKRLLAIEKECISNIEKSLHDLSAETAERKLVYEKKLLDARAMMETAKKKFDEAESKLCAAESIKAEACRFQDSAMRNLQDVEARENDLRRQLASFKSDCEEWEKEMRSQKQSLYESEKFFHEKEEKFFEKQKLLNQREEYVFDRIKELNLLEKKLDKAKNKLEEDCRLLSEERCSFGLNKAALSSREEVLIQREATLEKRECELLLLQEKVANKEHDEIHKRVEEHQSTLEKKAKLFEADFEQRRVKLDDEIKEKLATLVERKVVLDQREKDIAEKKKALEFQSSKMVEEEKTLREKVKLIEDMEHDLQSKHASIEMNMVQLLKEREDVENMKFKLEEERKSLEDVKTEVLQERGNLELVASERGELSVLENKLKEEIDSFRAQKMELEAEVDKLRTEKEKFEVEWELIDEKREEVRKEAQRVSEEREEVNKFLKNEYESINLEKELLRSQFKNEMEALSREREEFISKMEHEHSELFNKIQQEREDFLNDIKIQRRELEFCIDKRREEIENYLKEREEALEQERTKELQYINSQKDLVAKELERVSSELKRIHSERINIAQDRKQMEEEWTEIKLTIEMLNIRREKLQEQRKLLCADSVEITKQTEYLKELECLNMESENRVLAEVQPSYIRCSRRKIPLNKCSSMPKVAGESKQSDEMNSTKTDNSIPSLLLLKPSDSASPPLPATMSWVKRYASILFNRSPDKHLASGPEVEGKVLNQINPVLVEGEIATTLKPIQGKEEDEIINAISKPGRKRMNNSCSPRHVGLHMEPTQKLQKRTKENEYDQKKKTVTNCDLPVEVPKLDGGNFVLPEWTLERREEYEDHSFSNKKFVKPEVSQSNQLEEVWSRTSQTYMSDHAVDVGTGLLSAISCQTIASDTQDKVENVSAEAVKPQVSSAPSAAEVVTGNGVALGHDESSKRLPR